MDRASIVRRLAEAGCLAPDDEAVQLFRATDGDPLRLDALVSRRVQGEPLAWLTGYITFCGLELVVEPGVYVPRPQTEALARRAASLLPKNGVAVDLCTGCGAVAAVLAGAAANARVVATELDPVAVACARTNGVEVFEGSLDEPLPRTLAGSVDVLTAVVPYVPTDAIRLLPPDVQAFEPRLSLDGGADGMDLLAKAVGRSYRWLREGGWILLELGGDQAERIGQLLERDGYDEPEVMVDEEGDPRAMVARRRV